MLKTYFSNRLQCGLIYVIDSWEGCESLISHSRIKESQKYTRKYLPFLRHFHVPKLFWAPMRKPRSFEDFKDGPPQTLRFLTVPSCWGQISNNDPRIVKPKITAFKSNGWLCKLVPPHWPLFSFRNNAGFPTKFVL